MLRRPMCAYLPEVILAVLTQLWRNEPKPYRVVPAASAGVPMPIVSKSAGHQRKSTTTDVYQHLFPRDASEVANAVSSAVIPLLPTRDSEQRATSEGG